jgi:UDP-N-acetylglucosamine 4,6-dehydratase
LKQAQMASEINDPRVEYLLCGDIRDFDRLCVAMEGVDTVVHAAAMKRIEKCERDPQEAIKTNVQGSVNVANACLKQNVKASILISTDKACYPVNLYGATKLTAEKIWVQSNTYRGKNHPTRFSVVRYGNVLGSRGSVTHIFRDQLDKGAIKVTDQRMTRFFITLQQAVDLVQLAIEVQQGGEIFIPKLKATSIYHLAKLIAGKSPVMITNQRGGEKLHETLITKEESVRIASFVDFSVINPEYPSWPYKMWTSEFRSVIGSSEEAEQFTDAELRKLLA